MTQENFEGIRWQAFVLGAISATSLLWPIGLLVALVCFAAVILNAIVVFAATMCCNQHCDGCQCGGCCRGGGCCSHCAGGANFYCCDSLSLNCWTNLNFMGDVSQQRLLGRLFSHFFVLLTSACRKTLSDRYMSSLQVRCRWQTCNGCCSNNASIGATNSADCSSCGCCEGCCDNGSGCCDNDAGCSCDSCCGDGALTAPLHQMKQITRLHSTHVCFFTPIGCRLQFLPGL